MDVGQRRLDAAVAEPPRVDVARIDPQAEPEAGAVPRLVRIKPYASGMLRAWRKTLSGSNAATQPGITRGGR